MLDKKIKLHRMLKAFKSADEIYTVFIKSKSEHEKNEIVRILKDFAKVSNPEKDIRAKVLAMMRYYKYMSNGDAPDKFYKDIAFISNDLELIEIIEDNIRELTLLLEQENGGVFNNNNDYKLVVDSVLGIDVFNIKSQVAVHFIDLLKGRLLDLNEKEISTEISKRVSYLLGQLKRTNQIGLSKEVKN